MRQRKRRIQLSLASVGPEPLVAFSERMADAPAASMAPPAPRAHATRLAERTDPPFEAGVEVDVDLSEVALDAALETSRTTSEKHRRLGKQTMQILAPMMVVPLARSAPPPPRSGPSARIMLALAAVAVVLTSASVALAIG